MGHILCSAESNAYHLDGTSINTVSAEEISEVPSNIKILKR